MKTFTLNLLITISFAQMAFAAGTPTCLTEAEAKSTTAALPAVVSEVAGTAPGEAAP